MSEIPAIWLVHCGLWACCYQRRYQFWRVEAYRDQQQVAHHAVSCAPDRSID